MVENKSLENKCSPTKVGYERGGFRDRREMGSQERGVRGAVPTAARKCNSSPRRADRAPLLCCPAPVSEVGSPGQTAAHPDSPLPFAPSSPFHRSAPPFLFTYVRTYVAFTYVSTYVRTYISTYVRNVRTYVLTYVRQIERLPEVFARPCSKGRIEFRC